MKATFDLGLGNAFKKTVSFEGYVKLANDIYKAMETYKPKFKALDDELNAWYEAAIELQPDLNALDYFDFNDLKLTEDSAKKFLNRRSYANGRFGFHYTIEKEDDRTFEQRKLDSLEFQLRHEQQNLYDELWNIKFDKERGINEFTDEEIMIKKGKLKMIEQIISIYFNPFGEWTDLIKKWK